MNTRFCFFIFFNLLIKFTSNQNISKKGILSEMRFFGRLMCCMLFIYLDVFFWEVIIYLIYLEIFIFLHINNELKFSFMFFPFLLLYFLRYT